MAGSGVSVRVAPAASATMITMTELMSRPILRVKATAEPPRRPIVLSALVAGAAAASVGLVLSVSIAVGVWFAGDTGSFGAAVRVGAFGWLLSNGSGVEVSGTSITAIPLGFLALFGFLVYRAGRWSGATSSVRHGGDALSGALLIALGYAAVGGVVSRVASSPTAHTGLVRVLIALTAVGFVTGGLGVVRGSGSVEPVLALLPLTARAVLRGAAAGLAVMVLASALLFVGSAVMHFSQAVTLQEGLAAGTVGSLALALIGLATVPNAVLCAGAFIAGPGFQVGTGTSVAPVDVRLGRMPDFPVLAALPADTGHAWWQIVLVLLPVVAGGVAGLVALRRDPAFTLDQAALRGAASGLLGGVGFGALTWLARGSVGPGRMQDVGPDVLPVVAVCGLALLVGGAVAAGAARWWQAAPGQGRSGEPPTTDAGSLS